MKQSYKTKTSKNFGGFFVKKYFLFPYDFKNSKMSLLIVSASVVGIPCGNPGYDISFPFFNNFAALGA